MKKKVIPVLLAFTLTAVMAAGCGDETTETEETEAVVSTEETATIDVTENEETTEITETAEVTETVELLPVPTFDVTMETCTEDELSVFDREMYGSCVGYDCFCDFGTDDAAASSYASNKWTWFNINETSSFDEVYDQCVAIMGEPTEVTEGDGYNAGETYYIWHNADSTFTFKLTQNSYNVENLWHVEISVGEGYVTGGSDESVAVTDIYSYVEPADIKAEFGEDSIYKFSIIDDYNGYGWITIDLRGDSPSSHTYDFSCANWEYGDVTNYNGMDGIHDCGFTDPQDLVDAFTANFGEPEVDEYNEKYIWDIGSYTLTVYIPNGALIVSGIFVTEK